MTLLLIINRQVWYWVSFTRNAIFSNAKYKIGILLFKMQPLSRLLSWSNRKSFRRFQTFLKHISKRHGLRNQIKCFVNIHSWQVPGDIFFTNFNDIICQFTFITNTPVFHIGFDVWFVDTSTGNVSFCPKPICILVW